MTEAQLVAPYVLEYPYHRSTGPVIGRFLAGLRDRQVLGARAADGRIIVPPLDADPHTGARLDELVSVGHAGVVTTWTWVAQPRPKHLLQRPFAFALVKLDGADTALLHMVDAGSEAAMRTGMRVSVRWRDERSGSIADIECFEPERAGTAPPPAEAIATEPVTQIVTPVRLDYTIRPGVAMTRFLGGIAQGRIVAQRCPRCRKVYVPPRGSCPTCAVATEEDVELADRGIVTTFSIVRIPTPGLALRPPYCSAAILLDGADIPFLHLVGDVDVDQVRMGMRVEAVWVAPEERGPTVESIRWFRPTGEPDAPFDAYKEHMI